MIFLPVAEEAVLGVEVLAQAIDSIITRVQVAFIDTTFRLEYVPTIAPRGLALEIKVRELLRLKTNFKQFFLLFFFSMFELIFFFTTRLEASSTKEKQ